MSADPDREDPPEPLDEATEDVTLSNEDWPVPEHYRVEPTEEVADEAGTDVVVQDAAPGPAEPGPVRRFPPEVSRGLAAAVLAVLLLLLVIPAGLWLSSRTGEEASAEPDSTLDGAESPTSGASAPTGSASARVPEVTGLTLSSAQAALERAGFRVRFSRIDSERPRNEVLTQQPTADDQAKAGSIIVLTISRGGTGAVAVPAVEGLAVDRATELLRGAGFETRRLNVASDERPGTVVDQNPTAGAEVASGTVVALQVAKRSEQAPPPAEIETVTVPNLVGLSAQAARSRIRALGLRSTQRPVESSRPEGTVVGHSPTAGEELRKGGTMTLQVSTGSTLVEVPDVSGLDANAAVTELETAGFVVDVIDEPMAEPLEEGTVLRQSPRGGSTARNGATVTIVVARSA
jgi:beta-lactam-binding protein with PASTA domain